MPEGSIPQNESRRIDLRLRFQNTLSSQSRTASVAASNDRNSTNNTRDVRLEVLPAADGALTVAVPSVQGTTRQSLQISATLTASGVQALQNAVLNVTAGGLTLESVVAQGAVCSPQGSPTCRFGTIQAGESRRIDISVRGNRSGQFGVTFSPTSRIRGVEHSQVSD